MLDNVGRYFDLQSEQRANLEAAAGHAPVLPQYAALSLGVLAQPFLSKYASDGSIAFDVSVAAIIFALLMAIVLLPAVYKNAFDPQKPILVQLCALFTAGVGWEAMFKAVAKGATG